MTGEPAGGERIPAFPKMIALSYNADLEPDPAVTGLFGSQAQEARDNMRGLLPGSIDHTRELVRATVRERLLGDGVLNTDQIMEEFFREQAFSDLTAELDLIRVEHCCRTGEWVGDENVDLSETT